jgi:hypothetical protein
MLYLFQRDRSTYLGGDSIARSECWSRCATVQNWRQSSTRTPYRHTATVLGCLGFCCSRRERNRPNLVASPAYTHGGPHKHPAYWAGMSAGIGPSRPGHARSLLAEEEGPCVAAYAFGQFRSKLTLLEPNRKFDPTAAEWYNNSGGTCFRVGAVAVGPPALCKASTRTRSLVPPGRTGSRSPARGVALAV